MNEMRYDEEKTAPIALAILGLTMFEDGAVTRAWKGMDWDVLDALFRRGWILDPKGKAKSVVFTEEGARLARDLSRRHFGAATPSPGREPAQREAADPLAVLGGGCLCGAVRYELNGPFMRAGHCHCSRCRRHSGAAASTQGRVAREHFELVRGAEHVRTYRPDGGSAKAFCEHCGSSLFGGTWPDGPEVSIRLGTLDADPGIRPQYHTFVASKAPWDEIHDALPQHAGPLPADSAG